MSAPSRVREWFDALRDAVRDPEPVYAHCDIPCGIYDPHEAQIAALTIIRMDQLIGELPRPSPASKPEELDGYATKLGRYQLVKEQHAERLKQEVRIIWGDYFTADHAKQHPEIHDLTWKILKQASRARQGTNIADAQELLKLVQEFAEIFWKTKGATSKRQPSLQKPGGELVVPVPPA